MKVKNAGTVVIDNEKVAFNKFDFESDNSMSRKKAGIAAIKWAIERLEHERDLLETNQQNVEWNP